MGGQQSSDAPQEDTKAHKTVFAFVRGFRGICDRCSTQDVECECPSVRLRRKRSLPRLKLSRHPRASQRSRRQRTVKGRKTIRRCLIPRRHLPRKPSLSQKLQCLQVHRAPGAWPNSWRNRHPRRRPPRRRCNNQVLRSSLVSSLPRVLPKQRAKEKKGFTMFHPPRCLALVTGLCFYRMSCPKRTQTHPTKPFARCSSVRVVRVPERTRRALEWKNSVTRISKRVLDEFGTALRHGTAARHCVHHLAPLMHGRSGVLARCFGFSPLILNMPF